MPTRTNEIPLIIADIYELAGAFRRRGEAIARGVDQTQTRWQILSAASGAAKTVPQIARRLGVSRQNVQKIADLLVADDLARYAGNPDHRTSPLLVPTEAGAEALDALTRAARIFHAKLAARLKGADLARMRDGLRTLIAALGDIRTEEDEP
jgi:DNA-binding MarR family transcriptional regulator